VVFKGGPERVLGEAFASAEEAGRAWDRALLEMRGGNVAPEWLNFPEEAPALARALLAGQTAGQTAGGQSAPVLGAEVEGVRLRGRLRLMARRFTRELRLVAALADGYERLTVEDRWGLLGWLCDEAGETAAVRTEVEQRVALGKVFYNLQVQEKLLVNRQVIDAMEPPPFPPVLTGHVSSLPPVLTGHVSSGYGRHGAADAARAHCGQGNPHGGRAVRADGGARDRAQDAADHRLRRLQPRGRSPPPPLVLIGHAASLTPY
jgi:hypothetical protein